MPQLSDDPKERAAEEKCLSDIRDHGLHVLRVHGDDQWPEFAYSVGLYRNYQQAEVIILGLPLERAHAILNLIGDEARAGRRFAAGDVTDAVLNDYAVSFREVPSDHVKAHFGWALWYYGEEAFPALQLVYPDRDRRWPWESGVSDSFRSRQPVLEEVAVPAWARQRH